MKIGFCDRLFSISNISDLNEAGFECFSLCLFGNGEIELTKFADELCFFGKYTEEFFDAVKAAEKNSARCLVINEEFALQNAALLLSLPKMPFNIAIENENTDTDELMNFLSKTKNAPNRLGLCLNTGHAILHGKEPHELLRFFGDKVFSVHANDNHRTGDYHLPPFRGRDGVDWEKFAAALAETGYDGELYLDVKATRCTSEAIMKKSLTVLFLIAKEIAKMIKEKRDKL